ncbi:DNA gyrase, A subunit [Dunaliella salina]|uniref:DNA topoisomerase (ATP-hydrolyzing) n=1 Tax=Dunaliella salina TaxID=3046 RepID=A0ABQ7GFR4_DUNSA|nr:DNA gyrase, A subunit [Dunaliella salina]|eukprot:KAF5833451.1 DNA gyrase, A subunit [Dunaliella salina]
MRHPLIAGHGNFGSLDDDPPAAMRYTECRLQSLATDMLLTNLDEKVVKFIPTFDGSQDEPSVLPANIPHLLVNGTNGIAVGIATRIPPHNLLEVVAGLSAFIKNHDITNEELRQFVPGPDFPTGGVIGVGQGLVDAYGTGSGSVLLRAKVTVEDGEDGALSGTSKSRTRSRRSTATNIVISEVPFQTSKAELVVKIAELVEAKTLEGVVDVRDESDRQGLRVVVELKPGVSSDVVLAGLYKHTRLESRVACNMVALMDGTPKQLALRDFFKHFLAFRCDILMKRAQNQLGKAQERLHLVSGFLAAMARLDDVVQLIREAKDTAAARTALMNDIQLSVTQADATLALPLRRLTSMERTALEGELKQVSARSSFCGCYAGKLGAGLREGDCLTQVVRTTEGNRVLVVTSTGHAFSIPAAAIPPPSRSGYGSAIAQVLNTASSVPMVALVPLEPQPPSSDATTAGPSSAPASPKAAPASQAASKADEHEASISGDDGVGGVNSEMSEGGEGEGHGALETAAEEQFLLLLTQGGRIKRTPLTSNYYKTTKSGLSVMKVDSETDPVGWATSCGLYDIVLLASSSGRLLSFPVSQIPQVNRQGGSVKGMKLQDGHRVVGMTLVPASAYPSSPSPPEGAIGHRLSVLLVTAGGKGKRVPLHDLRTGSRGTMGSSCIKLNTKGTAGDSLAAVGLVSPDDEVLLGSVRGKIMRLQANSVEVASPKNSPRVLMDLHDGDSVQTIAVIPTGNKARDSTPSGSSSDQ